MRAPRGSQHREKHIAMPTSQRKMPRFREDLRSKRKPPNA